MSQTSFQQIVDSILKGEKIEENTVLNIIKTAQDILQAESNLLTLQSPINVCGDTHGQLYDVIALFEKFGLPGGTRYIFTGDYVDRGAYSVELLCLYLCYKILYPTSIYLLRGNHETSAVNREYGFFDEIQVKYGSDLIWQEANKLFQDLPIAALIDNKYFLVHGGICPGLNNVSQIQEINRKCEPELNSLLAQILWSDPSEVENWVRSERRTGYLYGPTQSETFVKNNNLKAIVRSHEMADGYKIHFGGSVITIWSAPNYCYVCENLGAVMIMKPTADPSFVYFTAMPQNRRKFPENLSKVYFM